MTGREWGRVDKLQDLQERLEASQGHAKALEIDNARLRDELFDLRQRIDELTKPAGQRAGVWQKAKRLSLRGAP